MLLPPLHYQSLTRCNPRCAPFICALLKLMELHKQMDKLLDIKFSFHCSFNTRNMTHFKCVETTKQGNNVKLLHDLFDT